MIPQRSTRKTLVSATIYPNASELPSRYGVTLISLVVSLLFSDINSSVVPSNNQVMGLVEQIYNRAKRKYGDEAGSTFPAKLLQVRTPTPI